jgi:hypothetical protein
MPVNKITIADNPTKRNNHKKSIENKRKSKKHKINKES